MQSSLNCFKDSMGYRERYKHLAKADKIVTKKTHPGGSICSYGYMSAWDVFISSQSTSSVSLLLALWFSFLLIHTQIKLRCSNPCRLNGRSERRCAPPASAWPGAGYCGHLDNEPTDESTLSLPILFLLFKQNKNKHFFYKQHSFFVVVVIFCDHMITESSKYKMILF